MLRNGDRFTGEVRQLERGRLTLKTDDAGTVEIEWDKVVSVTADAPFDLDDVRGRRYVGSLTPAPPGQLRVCWGDSENTVEILSRPATEGAQKNDYGITFALGWSF